MGTGLKYTVLTYIFDHYEKVHEVGEKDPSADYVLVTDDPCLKSDTWRVVFDKTLSKLSPLGRCYEVRFHPFRYADTPIVVRVDSSIGVRRPLTSLVDRFEGGFETGYFDRCLMIHPHRNTMPKEYEVWCAFREYPLKQAAKCMLLMERMGYDFNYRGLYQGCFEILRDNQVNRDVNDMVFGLLCSLGSDGKIERIDQTVTSFVLNRFFSDRISVMPVAEDIITDGDLMQWYLHNTDTEIPLKRDTIPPVLFDKPCKAIREG